MLFISMIFLIETLQEFLMMGCHNPWMNLKRQLDAFY